MTCTECFVPMHPKNGTPMEGTVGHGGHGLCSRCYQRSNRQERYPNLSRGPNLPRGKKLAPVQTSLTDDQVAVTRMVDRRVPVSERVAVLAILGLA
jgi:hypothetical protein